MDGRLASHAEQCRRLPAEWRAAVGDLRLLIEDVRLEMDELERAETNDPLRLGDEEARLFERMRASWGSSFYASAAALHAMSASFDRRTAALARSYATAMLMPIMMACPLHRRAYEKPLGYAGDYRMMELCFAREPGGEGLFGRFLHTIGQNYTLARAVVAREVVAREAIRAAVAAEGEGPVRILALAAGAAIELRRFLDETGPLRRPVELILLDQDRGAHETAHRHLTRALLERHRGDLAGHRALPALFGAPAPQAADARGATGRSRDAGGPRSRVFDRGSTTTCPSGSPERSRSSLYSRIREGGRLLLGNLVETPDSTWIMDYVWGWPLVYRTDETMLRPGRGPLAVGRARGNHARLPRDAASSSTSSSRLRCDERGGIRYAVGPLARDCRRAPATASPP